MFRGEYAWVSIYDGMYAISAWCPADEARQIQSYGDYNHKGDLVEVYGVFHRACNVHGGDLDIHCTSLDVIEEGYPVKHLVGNTEAYAAFVLGFIAVILIMVEFAINIVNFVKKWMEDRR